MGSCCDKRNCCDKRQCGNCLICECKCRSKKIHSAEDRRRRYLKDINAGRFEGTWNEYQAKCKRERYANGDY